MVPEPRSAYAVRFFLAAVIMLAVAASLSFGLYSFFPPVATRRSNEFSLAFGFSTLLLLMGSGCLFRAERSVQRERQKRFRRWLLLAMASGTLFVASQTYALTILIRSQPQPMDEDSAGAATFVAVFAALHAMHFLIALLFLCHITIQAMADRYDHEYYWGVTMTAWFWHALGIVWLAILVVMLIARMYVSQATSDGAT